ncbi:MAG: porin, partial [Ottowia sp.]|nr:porin [Ottowia sp.]
MMKKTLVALAVLGASGLVAAQSSVTLYGMADAGIGRAKYLNPTGKTQFMGGGSTVNNAPSRIGLKGTEAIGGGNVVGFAFEHGLSLEDGRSIEFAGAEPLWDSYKGTDRATYFWDRDAHVFIAGGWGALKLGRQVSPTHISEAQYDLTGLANYSAMRGTFKATGFPVWNPTIAYFSPNMGGLTVAVAFVPKENNRAATSANKNAWDLAAWYHNGGLGVTASVNKGLNDSKTNWQVGAKYSFSNFTVAGSYHSVHADGFNYPTTLAAPGAVRRG